MTNGITLATTFRKHIWISSLSMGIAHVEFISLMTESAIFAFEATGDAMWP
jgi:hypothetical protein